LALDMAAPVEALERPDHAERRGYELLAEAADLQDRRQVREEQPAGHERLGGVLHHPPRLGQVEYDAVDLALVDSFVHVPHVYVERNVRAEETMDVLYGTLREVVAYLVARDRAGRPDGAQQRAGERARADARLENTRPREHAGKDPART